MYMIAEGVISVRDQWNLEGRCSRRVHGSADAVSPLLPVSPDSELDRALIQESRDDTL